MFGVFAAADDQGSALGLLEREHAWCGVGYGLEPQGRWTEFVQAFTDLVRSFNIAVDGTVRISSEYFLITVDR